MKIIFLDIDGVLNSVKTSVAHGGYPTALEHSEAFDWVAIKLLQRLCDSSGAQIVLSSAWRLWFDFADVGKAFGLPIIDGTPSFRGSRGHEINYWLQGHPEVQCYAILDDDPDMLPAQQAHFVQTSGFDGMTWGCYVRLCAILGEPHYAGEPRNRDWKSKP